MAIDVRGLQEGELAEADAIYRRAFGTFLGLPEPLAFDGDAQLVRCRFAADPGSAIALLEDGALAGTAFVTRWGSVSVLGPVTIDPPRQGRGLAHPLVGEALRLLTGPQVTLCGLFTFAESPTHVALGQRFGFWPASLLALMSKEVAPTAAEVEGLELLSRLSADAQADALSACRELTETLFEGLDVTGEILTVGEQETGDTVLVLDGPQVVGFAVCQTGKGSEAGSGRAAVRFAAVPGDAAGGQRLQRLLGAVEAWAASKGASVVTAGTGSGRLRAWQTLRAAGYRPFLQGLAMHRDRHPGYDRDDVLVLDDWR